MSNKDPFGEHAPAAFRQHLPVLGATFEFTSDDARLLRLVQAAYGGLRPHRLPAKSPRIRIRLQLTGGGNSSFEREPARVRTHGDGTFLCAMMDADNFAMLCPPMRSGLVGISRELLRFPYHARYELLEFAVFTLAARVQGLVPLHAGCVGRKGRGVLLIGASGAGKSTLAFQGMSEGLELLAEDAVFVAPRSLRAVGVPNFLHLRGDSLRFVGGAALTARIRKSPVITRRSGVKKFEVDLRRAGFSVAAGPLDLAAIVFVSRRKAARESALLAPLTQAQCIARLAASQPYAARQSGWPLFVKSLARIGAFELRRGGHPMQAARALRTLVDWGQKSR